MIWENSIETCIMSCMKQVASPGSMHDTGCLGLVLIFLGLCRKPIKPQHGTCSVHVGRRRPLKSLKVPHLRHLLKWVLEAQAGK